jgi:hypothetical protein
MRAERDTAADSRGARVGEDGDELVSRGVPHADAAFGIGAVNRAGGDHGAGRVERDAVDSLAVRGGEGGGELVGCRIPQVNAGVEVARG